MWPPFDNVVTDDGSIKHIWITDETVGDPWCQNKWQMQETDRKKVRSRQDHVPAGMRAENFREKISVRNTVPWYFHQQLNALPVANGLGKCVQDIDGRCDPFCEIVVAIFGIH